jgi:hypothetical protein
MSQALYTAQGLAFYPMETNPTWDRVEIIKKALRLKADTEFYRLAGADKGLGGQWKSGKVQMIGAEYAFKIQDKTGFQARWIMLGEGKSRGPDDDPLIVETVGYMRACDNIGRSIIHDKARDVAKEHPNVKETAA